MSPQQIQRFNNKWIPEPYSGCWLWTSIITIYNYGEIRCANQRLRAHRASWLIHRGPIPSGLCVCHKCDTRLCVNPDHLFLGTYGDNNRDCVKKGRQRDQHGEANPKAKLTIEAVELIRQSDLPQKLLARTYGVHQSTISLIKTGRTWCHHKNV